VDSNANVLAENIDSLKISFYTITGSAATTWQTIRSAGLVVEARTSLPDNRYQGYGDHKRRLKLTTKFRVKNRV
jgi:hypothetical protein